MKAEFETCTTTQTEALGARIAGELTAQRPGARLQICMYGDMGAGKTAFVRGVASVLSPGSRVKSPTYTIVHEYLRGDIPLFHFDLYRLEGDEDALDGIGFEEYLERGHCMIEWSEYLPRPLADAVRVTITKCGEERRKIKIEF